MGGLRNHRGGRPPTHPTHTAGKDQEPNGRRDGPKPPGRGRGGNYFGVRYILTYTFKALKHVNHCAKERINVGASPRRARLERKTLESGKISS